MVESTYELQSKNKNSDAQKPKQKSKPFLMSIHEASHVKPLLERLIQSESNWRETLNKGDWRLKWVSCNIPDEDLV